MQKNRKKLQLGNKKKKKIHNLLPFKYLFAICIIFS